MNCVPPQKSPHSHPPATAPQSPAHTPRTPCPRHPATQEKSPRAVPSPQASSPPHAGTHSSHPTQTHAAQSPPRQTPLPRSATASAPPSIQTQIQTCHSPNFIIVTYTSIISTHTLAHANKPAIIAPTNGRPTKDRICETRYTRHEVAAPRAVGPSGRTQSLLN